MGWESRTISRVGEIARRVARGQEDLPRAEPTPFLGIVTDPLGRLPLTLVESFTRRVRRRLAAVTRTGRVAWRERFLAEPRSGLDVAGGVRS